MGGRLLKEALKKYKSKYAVIIVSVLFAISHANLPQFISALCLGLLCGGVYVMAKDIKAPITIHVANNLYSSMMTLRARNQLLFVTHNFLPVVRKPHFRK